MFSIIVAHDENNAIGKANQLLWHIAEDLAFFKETTLNHTIVMGRKTFESIGKPLPKRQTIVLSTNEIAVDGVEVMSFEAVLQRFLNSPEEVFICGGAEIYQLFLPYVQKMYISKVSGQHDADTYFPTWNQQDFICVHTKVLGDQVIMHQYERKL